MAYSALLSHGFYRCSLGSWDTNGGSSVVGHALKELRVSLLNSVWKHLFLAMAPKLHVRASLLSHDSKPHVGATPLGHSS